MKHSFFIITSVHLDYPLYIAMNGILSIADMREYEVAWTVIRHITTLSSDCFFIDKCLCRDFKNALIKIDFTFK